MKAQSKKLHEKAQQRWRAPEQICSQWEDAEQIDSRLLEFKAKGQFWEVLERLKATLLVTREYEHLVLAMGATKGRPDISFMPLPHPSGLAVNRKKQTVQIAATRNPNQIFEFRTTSDEKVRLDSKPTKNMKGLLVPVRSGFYPGCLYMHDLAWVGDSLYANAVGENAIVKLDLNGGCERVWWPMCIENSSGKPVFERNHIQLNSIAPGSTLEKSFFSASSESISRLRPGHKNYPVDGKGVIFSGLTREPVVRGLTRPHSARLIEGKLWVDNSGYGQVGYADDGKLEVVQSLPGWTRGLCQIEDIVFVGTSRVIPKFKQYAPGLDVDKSVCGLHALSRLTGEVLGSLIWPYGNQIFAIDWISSYVAKGFPFQINRMKSASREQNTEWEKRLFYSYIADENR